MKKRFSRKLSIGAVLLAVLMAALMAGCAAAMTGCGSQPAVDADAEAAADADAESPVADAEAGPVSATFIVFDDTIVDPLFQMMGGAGVHVEGSAVLKLALSETSPGVYAGDGTLERETLMGGASHDVTNISSIYYRLSFRDIKPDEPGQGVTAMFNITDNSSAFGGEDGDLGVWDIHMRYNQQMPAGYKLTFEGDKARLFINTGFGFEFTGSIAQADPGKPKPEQKIGSSISVNSVFYETGEIFNHEYRAMLTAVPVSDAGYAGELCFYGSAGGTPFVDEEVEFTLLPFDHEAYREAGGVLPGDFDAFGLIDDKYIVLIDGERPLIEPVNSSMVFYGAFIEESEADEARRIAEDTKELMRTLYDSPDPTKADLSATPGGWKGKAPWYPEWLMPIPIDDSDWYWYEMMNEMGFNRYRAEYSEEASLEEVFEYYTAQLSGYDGFKSYDPGGSDAAIYFTKGAYSIMFMLSADMPESTKVVVSIT